MRSSLGNNLVELMSQSKNYQNHRRKVEQIMNKETNGTDMKRLQTMSNLQNFRVKAIRHELKKKQQQLQRDNDLIFQKILKVNQRRNQSLTGITSNSSARSFSHKNLTSLRKTISTINNENNYLAQKLITTKSNLSQDKLMSSYRKHLEVKERLKKYQYDEQYGVIPKKIISLEKIKNNVKNFNNSSSRIDFGSSRAKYNMIKNNQYMEENEEN